MQIILLEKIANLGNLGDVVKVKDGYARNFLIPGKHARRATEAAIKEFETRRADLEKAAAEKLAAAQALQEQLSGKVVRISQKAGVDGRLFGSVTNADIAEGLTQDGLRDPEVAGAHAQRPAEGDRRSHGVGVAAHRRGGRDHRAGGRRSRLIRLHRDCPEGRLSTGLLRLRAARNELISTAYATCYPQACAQASGLRARL